MRACASLRFGELGELAIRDLPQPAPGAGQLLVRVHAAAVNPADFKVLSHRDGGSFLHASHFPLVLGFDFSGTVAAIGHGGAGHAETAPVHTLGEDVYGFLPYARSTRGGTFAEYVVVDGRSVATKAKAMTHEQAAAAATSAVTALQALRDKGRIASGQRVLVNGGSGGVGAYAVQIAKLLGATVTATASAAKLEFVKQQGADRVVDYKVTPIGKLDETYDLILDAAAASTYGQCAPLLARGGAYVSTLPSAGLFFAMARTTFSTKRAAFLVVKPLAADLQQIATWHQEGKLAPIVERIYPLDEVVAAITRQQSGAVAGKLAIAIAA